MAGSTTLPARLVATLLSLLMATGLAAGDEIVLARGGKAKLKIVVPGDANETERAAARELSEHLKRVTGARFRVKSERPKKRARQGIYLGETAFARECGVARSLSEPESWSVSTCRGSLVLAGGDARGSLYATYHFLEDVVGVRWWTPWEDDVPQREELRVGPLDLAGKPAFVYRDIYGTAGPRLYWARNRVNGHFTYLSGRYGGREAYGPPDQVHNLYRYVPPDEYFDEHPEYFAEVDGERRDESAQLCFTNAELAGLVGEKLKQYIEQAQRDARKQGDPAPRLFAISQNDVGGACSCGECSELFEREGSHAGALVQFINRVAGTIAREHPEVLVDTLAYGFTLDPPRSLSYEDNVSVRLAALYGRNFAKPITHPAHDWYRSAIEGWSRRTAHLRIWDYIVTFGPGANLPVPNLELLAVDLRYYLDHGVEGVFVQQSHPVLSDMRDLKLWVTAKLLENPRRELGALVTEFTDGYYREAGEEIRAYLALLDEAAALDAPTLGYPTELADHAYLDGAFLFRAHEIYDRAEQRVADDPRARVRVRRARISLDRATVLLWEDRFGLDSSVRDEAGRELGLKAVAERARDAVHATIERRIPQAQGERRRKAIDRELGRVIAPYMERDAAARQ